MLSRLAYTADERADLHLHSHHSDGLHGPAELAALAAGAGLAVVALTDHATVEGVPEASVAGSRLGLHVIPGVELNASDGDLLAYWVDNFHPPFLAFLAGLRAQRAARTKAILARLRKLDITVELQELTRFAAPAVPTRTHLARLLVAQGRCASVDEAFQRWLRRGGTAWVPAEAPDMAHCLERVRLAGGVAVEAHPVYQLEGCDTDLERRYAALREAGLAGVELPPRPPLALAPLAARIAHAAQRCGLLTLGGSNFHGEGVTRARLGQATIGCDKLRLLEARSPPDGLYRDSLKRNAWRASRLTPAELEQSFSPITVRAESALRRDLLAIAPPTDRPTRYPTGRPFVLLGPGAIPHEADMVATLVATGARRIFAASGTDYPRVAWHVYEMFGGERARDPRDLLRFALDQHLWGEKARHCRVLWFDAAPGTDLELLKAELRRGIGAMRFYRVVAEGLRDTAFTSYLHLPDPEDIDRECWHMSRLGLMDPIAS